MKINTGFEFETQAISMALWKKNSIDTKTKIIYQPTKFFKKTLFESPEKIIQVYPDDLKRSTAFYLQQIQPFVDRFSSSSSSSLELDALGHQFVIPIDNQDHDLKTLFTHAEFIVTYPKNQEIPCTKKSLLNFLLEKTKDAVLDIQNIFGDLFPITQPIDKEDLTHNGIKKKTIFPYKYVSKSRLQDIVFFFQKDPTYFSSQFRFVAQTTIGIPFQNVPQVMKLLTDAFTQAGGNLSFDVMELTERYVHDIFHKYKSHWYTDPKVIQSFLFMLFYSAITHRSRKCQALFVIRSTLWHLSINEIENQDIDLLQLILVNDYLSDPVATYVDTIFSDYHSNLTDHERRQKQNIVDVTTIPYSKNNGTVFIEFRGLRTLLSHQCKGTPKSNLYLNDILFCKPF
jgi:hypothetical protein